ncbi:MAG: hypothetical protein AAB602_03195 [Patescibacteria group bacterium]
MPQPQKTGTLKDLVQQLLDFIHEGNGIRENSIALLKDLRKFKPKVFGNRKKLSKYETRFFDTDDDFLEYDKDAGLWVESLAVANVITETPGHTRQPTLEERNLFSIHASNLDAQRGTLRNLRRDIENRIHNFKEETNNKTLRFVAYVSLVVAVAGVILTMVAN